jgi:hypothetical protein
MVAARGAIKERPMSDLEAPSDNPAEAGGSKAAQRLIAVLTEATQQPLTPADVPTVRARLQQELDDLEAERSANPGKGKPLAEALVDIAKAASTHTHQTGVLIPRGLPGVWTDPYRPKPAQGFCGAHLDEEHFLARSDAKNAALHTLLTIDLPFREEDGTTGAARLLDLVARGPQRPGGFLVGLADCVVQTAQGLRPMRDILAGALPTEASPAKVVPDQHALLYWPTGPNAYCLVTPLTSVSVFGEMQALLGRTGAYEAMRGASAVSSKRRAAPAEMPAASEDDLEYQVPSRRLNFSENRWRNMGSGWPGTVGKQGGWALAADLPAYEHGRGLDRLSLNRHGSQARNAFQAFHRTLISGRPDNKHARDAVEAAMRRLFDAIVQPISEADVTSGEPTTWMGRAAVGEMAPDDWTAARHDILNAVRGLQRDVSLSAETLEWLERVLDSWLRDKRREWE